MLKRKGDVTDVAIIASIFALEGYRHLWQPFIEHMDKEHVLAAFGAELHDKREMGDIFSSFSEDNGTTWSRPVKIFDHRDKFGAIQFAYANPILYHPPGQSSIWCFAMRCPIYYADSEDAHLCAAYSVDKGRSWTPVELAVHYHSPLATCAGIVDVPDGDFFRYLLPVHRNTARHDPQGQRDQLILESSNLLEWKLSCYIPKPETPPVFMHEGHIAPIKGQDALKIVMRTCRADREGHPLNPPCVFSSESLDNGRTWSVAQPESELYNTVAKAFFGRDSFGNHIYVFSTGPAWERKELAYKIKPLNAPWSDTHVFYNAGVRNSYPTLLEKEPGIFYAVWDSSTNPNTQRTAIRFGKLDITSFNES